MCKALGDVVAGDTGKYSVGGIWESLVGSRWWSKIGNQVKEQQQMQPSWTGLYIPFYFVGNVELQVEISTCRTQSAELREESAEGRKQWLASQEPVETAIEKTTYVNTQLL